MSRHRIAIATCADYADLKVDDALLREALQARGAEATAVVWDHAEADWGDFDACLIRSTRDYHEKHPEFLAWARRVEAAMPPHRFHPFGPYRGAKGGNDEARLWNPAEMVEWNSNKTYLRELAESGVRIVPTIWIECGKRPSLNELLAAQGWEEGVVKPVVDLGARNLSHVRADAEGQATLTRILDQHDAMVQPFLPSLEAQGELSLIYIAGQLSHAVRKRPAPGDFRVQSIWGGSVEPAEPTPEHVELAERALSQVAPTPLYARVDLVDDLDGRPCLIELELIEPNLYLSTHPPAVDALADALLLRIDVDADRDVLE
ncbi:MAG: ATP-grasp domain-containing protein [Solirubrobacterales bacterium]